jgi:AcrR family transcriptional regulator
MATPVTGRPPRPMSTRAVQAEQTRQQILETAQRLFAELGYDATSLQMIADDMGLTKAAVYYHFRAKSDILYAAMQPGIERVEALLNVVAALRSRRARMECMVTGLVDFLVENRHLAVMASNEPAAKRHKLDEESVAMKERALTLFYGDDPTGAERLSFFAAFCIPETLPDMVDLSDDELREALQSTLLRILRVPS